MDLDTLAEAEDQLFREVMSWPGTMEQKMTRLLNSDVPSRYRLILHQYCEMARSGDEEALKRALFIQWYGAVEPSIYTGIHALAQSECQAIVQLVLDRCDDASVDSELLFMLGWYLDVAEWYFHTVCGEPCVSHLRRCVEDLDRAAGRTGTAFPEGRGQMSEYFRSL